MSLRTVLFSSRGWASFCLPRLRADGHHVVGACLAGKRSRIPSTLRRELRRIGSLFRGATTSSFYFYDPKIACADPRPLARQWGIPVLRGEQITSRRFREGLAGWRPDMVFVCGFPRIIPESLIGIPKLGTINFHPSLLPRHRGATPARWVLLEGEESTGVTAHYVTPRLDEGDVIAYRELQVYPDEDWGHLELRLMHLAADLMSEVAAWLASGERLPRTPQDAAMATYEPPFRQSHSVIDWTESASRVTRRCRAARPKWGGITAVSGRPLCIWEAKEIDKSGPAGEVLTVSEDGFDVGCGEGSVRVELLLTRARSLARPKDASLQDSLRPGTVFDRPEEVRAIFGW